MNTHSNSDKLIFCTLPWPEIFPVAQANINANSGGNNNINSSTSMQTSGAGFTNGNANHKDASNATNTTDSNTIKGNSSSSANSASSGSASGLNSASAQYAKSSELNASVVDSSKSCFGCGVPCTQTVATPNGPLCNSCHHHWRYSSQKLTRKSIFNLIVFFISLWMNKHILTLHPRLELKFRFLYLFIYQIFEFH